MTQTLLLIIVISVVLFFANKNGNKTDKDNQNLMPNNTEKKSSTMLLWEDDYLMAEIMSADNLQFAKREIGKVTELSEIKKIETSELGISKTDLSDLLINSDLDKYERISYAGIGEPHISENTGSVAFGSLLSAIFFDGEDDKVEHIWLSSINWKEVNKTNIANGLNAIGKKYNMILVDIYPVQNKIVDLTNQIEIQNYLDVYIKARIEE